MHACNLSWKRFNIIPSNKSQFQIGRWLITRRCRSTVANLKLQTIRKNDKYDERFIRYCISNISRQSPKINVRLVLQLARSTFSIYHADRLYACLLHAQKFKENVHTKKLKIVNVNSNSILIYCMYISNRNQYLISIDFARLM